MFTKESIREQMQNLRMALSENDVSKASKACVNRILSLAEYQESKTIFLYAAVRNEVDVTPLFEYALQDGKQVAFPVSSEYGELDFYVVFDRGDFHKGKFGILEPPKDILVLPDEDTMVLVPAVAFDIRKNRIGQGKGYYDRYFDRYPDALRIGVAYDFQVVDAFEPQRHDKQMDFIVTDTKIIV